MGWVDYDLHGPEKSVRNKYCCCEQSIGKQHFFLFMVVHNNKICSVLIFPGCDDL